MADRAFATSFYVHILGSTVYGKINHMTARYSVLVVDDESVLRDVCEIVLSSAGYQVHTATNGAEALTLLNKAKPDVILLDLFMPVMSGEEFLKNFDHTLLPNTKIVVYSNASDKSTESDMLQLGAHAVVLKSSLAPSDLVALVAQHTQ